MSDVGAGCWRARRVDLIIAPTSQYYYALVGWTGSKHFNRSLRLYAQRRFGWHLTSHCLYDPATVSVHMFTYLDYLLFVKYFQQIHFNGCFEVNMVLVQSSSSTSICSGREPVRISDTGCPVAIQQSQHSRKQKPTHTRENHSLAYSFAPPPPDSSGNGCCTPMPVSLLVKYL